jgi:predicted DCC family thiol-disulfide oxidoreductase YuxK
VSETATDVADEALAKVPDGGAIVLFDGVCNFCAWSVRFIHEHDDDTVRFAPLQSEVGRALLETQGLSADYFDSLVYIGADGVHTKSDGAVRIARHLEGPWRAAWLARYVPRPVRDVGYDVLGKVRYRIFGKKESCMIPGPELRARFLDDPTDEFGNVQTA